jgi:hypothetical protein
VARTTLVIEDAILRELKTRAAREGRTFQEVANEAMRLGLRAPKGRYRLDWEPWDSELQPGVDLDDRDRLYELLDPLERWSR